MPHIGAIVRTKEQPTETFVVVADQGHGILQCLALVLSSSADEGITCFVDGHSSRYTLSAPTAQLNTEDSIRVGELPLPELSKALRRLTRHVGALHQHVIDAQRTSFSPGQPVPYAGRIYGEAEVTAAIDASLDFWLTAGKYSDEFEHSFAQTLGVRSALLVNSGSSANLLACSALTSPSLGEKRLRAGDEVITLAAGFPTTVAPIIQNRAIPVFVDIQIPTYNIDTDLLEAALSPRTRAVMIAHTLGNPFAVKKVLEFCKKHDLFLVEDNCDALGSEVLVDGNWKLTGSFGDVATSSFYPPHHITMGEGGAVYTNSPRIAKAVASFRDWGRDCWCPSGKDNTCGKRFDWKLGNLPEGYDHKYIYSHFGYNLKATDLQAAIGCQQLKRLPEFVRLRRRNWEILRKGLADFQDVFIMPEATPETKPSWFGFLLAIRENAGFTRQSFVRHLDQQKIHTRMLFGGNITRQPCMNTLEDMAATWKVIGDLKNSDFVMNQGVWLGVYPGLTEQMLAFVVDQIKRFISNRSLW